MPPKSMLAQTIALVNQIPHPSGAESMRNLVDPWVQRCELLTRSVAGQPPTETKGPLTCSGVWGRSRQERVDLCHGGVVVERRTCPQE